MNISILILLLIIIVVITYFIIKNYKSILYIPYITYKFKKLDKIYRILITIPHYVAHSVHLDKNWHTNDRAAPEAANYLKKHFENKNVIVKIIKAQQNRYSLRNNTIPDGIDDNRLEGCINSKYISKYKNMEGITCDKGTYLWRELIKEIRNNRPDLVIDCHSYNNKYFEHDIEIFTYRYQLKKIRKFIERHEEIFNEYNIGLTRILTTNRLNAITEFCNQNEINSMLLEFNEDSKEIEYRCKIITEIIYSNYLKTI